MSEREASGLYVTCYETLAWTCPFCGADVHDQSEKFPSKCEKCGAVFVVKVIAYLPKEVTEAEAPAEKLP